MAEEKERVTPKSRIESLSDLIFGLALSIGALTLIGQPPRDFSQLVLDLLYFAFSFLILISVWYSYTRTMAQLRIETPMMINLNILLLFLVSVEPFLFNQLNSAFEQNVSVLYALDLGGLFIIQALLANSILTDKSTVRSKEILSSYTIRRNTLFLGAAFFFISALPFFWSWTLTINNTFTIPLRTILWLIPLFSPTIRRLLERRLKTN